MIEVRLSPDNEAKLLSQASTRGLDVDQDVAMLLTDVDEDHVGFREGLADIAAGRVRPADKVFAELHARYGISG